MGKKNKLIGRKEGRKICAPKVTTIDQKRRILFKVSNGYSAVNLKGVIGDHRYMPFLLPELVLKLSEFDLDISK